MHMASKTKNKTAPSIGKIAQETPRRTPKSPKPTRQNKPKGSIGLGLLLIVIGTSLIGSGGLGYLFYQELLGGAKREVDLSSEAQSQQLEAKLANMRQATTGLVIATKALAQQSPKPKTIDGYQKLVVEGLQRSETIVGIGIAQNDNLLFTAPKSTVPYVWTEQSGLKLEPSGKKLPAPNDKLLAGNRSDLSNSPQYKLPITSAKESWSEPYNALGKTIITYSVPITDGQKILGVVNADAIASKLVSIPATNPNSESKIGFVVISASGKVITASEQFQSTQAQNPAAIEAIKNLAQQVKSQPIGISKSGGNLWAYRKIEGSDWLLASYLPESEITNKLFVLFGGATLGISAILGIAVLGFINSLKKRLQPLTEECDRFLAQQGSSNLDLAGKDEIDRLSLSLKSSLQQVKTNEIRLRNELVQNPLLDDISTAQAQQNIAETELMEAEVGDLLDVVSSMEEGDLTIEAQVNDRATGLVADTLNRLREKLVEIISSVLGTAQQVAQGASDLEELARTVVLNTAEQAQSIAQGQALTSQVAAIAERSSAQVNVANQSLQEVRNTVASGQTAINNLTESISVLQTGSAQIVQRMKTLGEFVGLAEQFVQDQGQIASLTQVLALNATLVAARAAEQKDPQQFAGVAREFESIAGQVNDLATQTNDGLTVLQQRTSQIQTVVSAIDAEVQNLSGLVSGFTTGVEDSQSAFNSIQIATEEVVQIGQTITESSTEIVDAAGSTASYISEIAQLADRTADLTRSARQQAEAMGNQAQQLLQGIQFFRLPESSNLPTSNNFAVTNVATTSEVNAFVDSPDNIHDTSVNSLFDSTIETTEANGNDRLGLVLPVIAVAAGATAVAISQTGQNAESAAPEEEIDNTALDGKYLENLLDEGIDTDINDEISGTHEFVEPTDIEIPQEKNFADNLIPKHESVNPFLDPDDNPYREAAEASYSGLTDISIIEESLLADLRQEIYNEATFSNEDEIIVAPEQSLASVNKFAIVEASSDPMIVSATSSFLEDTAFGNASSHSEDSNSNLPISLDFSIPDHDDYNFSIPKTPIEPTLDDSNLFFDSNSIQQNDIESDSDPFAIAEQIQTESNAYNISDDVFYSDHQDEGITDEFLSDGLSDEFIANQAEDYNEFPDVNLLSTSDTTFTDAFDISPEQSPLDVSEDLHSPIKSFLGNNSDDFGATQTGDYNDYVSHEEFNSSLGENLDSSSNQAFVNTFNSSFDESPFDDAFGEALNNSDTINDFDIQNVFNQISVGDLPRSIPDIYLDELTDDELTDEVSFVFPIDFQDNSSLSTDVTNLAEADDSIFNQPNLNTIHVNEKIIDPFAIQEAQESDIAMDTETKNYFDNLESESIDNAAWDLQAIASSDGLLEFSKTIDSGSISPVNTPVYTLDLEESEILQSLCNDLNNLDLPESNLDVAESIFGNIQIEPSFIKTTPNLSPDISEVFVENFSDNWLEEIVTNEDENVSVFENLYIDKYQSVGDLTANSLFEVASEPNYGFADNLLDSLMEESNEEIIDLSIEVPDLFLNTGLPLTNPLVPVNTLSDDLDDLSDDYESDFDFSAFDGLVDDSNNLVVATLETSININPISNADTSINTTITAREEIDNFLSSTALGFERIDNTIPRKIIPNDEKEPKPQKPIQND